jgi:peroxiredoxin
VARTKVAAVPEVGNEAPEFHLPSAQGGQLRLSMRTARGPVVVVFYRGLDFEEDVEYFKELAKNEDEINLAAGSVVGIGLSEPDEAREFVRKSGIKSYVLYDYARAASRDWGLLEKDKKRGEYVRPAVFIVGTDREVVHAWVDERPDPAEILAKVSEITGLPKPPEEEDEEKPKKPKRAKAEGDADSPDAPEKPERRKLTPEEREKRRAERKAARESGETGATSEAGKPDGEKDPRAGNEVKPSAPEDGSGADTEESKKAGE